MAEPKLAQSVAEQEFQRFAEAMDLDVDTGAMNQETLAMFERHHKIVIRALMSGALIIDDKGQPLYTPTVADDKEPLLFSEPKGDAHMAADMKKPDQNVAKLYAQLAAWTGTSVKRFSSMPQRDLKVCEALFVIFFA